MTTRVPAVRARWAPVVLALTLGASALAGAAPARAAQGSPRAVVVRAGSVEAAVAAVTAVGGRVDEALPIIDGAAAHVTDAGFAALGAMSGVQVTPDVVLHPTAASFAPASVDTQLAAIDPGSGWSPTAGRGVGIALVDTGVADTPDLHAPRLVRSPDFSGEGDGIDHYGHGTFMAGLIAGDGTASAGSSPRHYGVAPGATLISVKVADATGASSLSRVLAGIGWVVANRDQYDIGVINLSFGVDTNAPYVVNPLDAAAEAAWASGITVVTAAGNSGADHVTSPGDDPYVISVGATDTMGTPSTRDDTVPTWSSREHFRGYDKPDIVAPGVSLVSLRAPGSTVDSQHPDARVGSAYFRGTGTSMSTAMVSGAVAALLEHHGDSTPDDVKGALVDAGSKIGNGIRALDVLAADGANATGDWWQHFPVAFGGLGRGLRNGMPWTASRWRNETWTASRWRGLAWDASRWRDGVWDASRWRYESWTASRWRDESWTTDAWAASRWRALDWSADAWVSKRWG